MLHEQQCQAGPFLSEVVVGKSASSLRIAPSPSVHCHAPTRTTQLTCLASPHDITSTVARRRAAVSAMQQRLCIRHARGKGHAVLPHSSKRCTIINVRPGSTSFRRLGLKVGMYQAGADGEGCLIDCAMGLQPDLRGRGMWREDASAVAIRC